MTFLAFALAVVRVLAIVAPSYVAARWVRQRLRPSTGAASWLIEVTLVLSWLIVLAEILGLFNALRLGWLIAASWTMAGLVMWVCRSEGVTARRDPQPPSDPRTFRVSVGSRVSLGLCCAAVVVWLVLTQWLFATANALGGGMTSFDVLWYHMPFAAAFAQTHATTHVLFTQADPFVAYYPADSELIHAVGIIGFGNDFLSPLLNLGWLALGLTASWSVGTRYEVQRWTLCAGAVAFALPVLGSTQPGEAFNDIVGLAALATALALLMVPDRGALERGVAALVIGIAVGTKYTFLVPAVVMIAGEVWLTRRLHPVRTGLLLVCVTFLTGGWWYLRALIDTGSPLGLSQSVGPVHLTGATSPLAVASSQTVVSQLSHGSLWGSRFLPGLTHALGVLWPLILLSVLFAVMLGLRLIRREPWLGVGAIATGCAAVTYLVFPTGASDIQQSSTLFAVNIRYFMPAVELGLLITPPLLNATRPRVLAPVGMVLALAAFAAQFEGNIWPTQLKRHVAFMVISAAALSVAWLAYRHRATLKRRGRWAAGLVSLIVVIGAGDLVQHHYFSQRYLLGTGTAGLTQIDRWAQTVNNAKIALYGTVEQYPFYGAQVTNTVTYLGQPAAHGGYQPISSCSVFGHVLNTGNFQYLIVTPGPTGSLPTNWLAENPGLTVVLHPTPTDWVFRLATHDPHTVCPPA